MLSEKDLINTYRRDGVAVIRNVFNLDEINSLRSAAFMVLTCLDEITRGGYKHQPLEIKRNGTTESPALVFWPCLANQVLDAFRTDRRLSGAVELILGPDVKQLNNQMYYRLPGDQDSFAWHQDIMFRAPLTEYPNIVEEDGYLQTAIIVDKMNAENGGIEFVLGSHRLGNLGLMHVEDLTDFRSFNRLKNSTKFAHLPTRIFELNPGDLLVWSSQTVHGSQPNTSSLHRMYYMNGFAKSACSKPWPHYLMNGKLCALDTEALP